MTTGRGAGGADYYVVPHSTIPLAQIRPMDIFMLLGLGALWEILSRLALRYAQAKPASLVQRERDLKLLTILTNQKRALGPQAFVETSRLERQLLVDTKELGAAQEQRKADLIRFKSNLRKISYGVSFLIFFVYYGIPILCMDGSKVAAQAGWIVTSAEEASTHSTAYLSALLFPIGYIGMGIKVSRFGLETPRSSVGSTHGILVRSSHDGTNHGWAGCTVRNWKIK
jgi:hypothetical protein